MATVSLSSTFLPARAASLRTPSAPQQMTTKINRVSPVRAAQLPKGAPSPKELPRLPEPFFGFTQNAEIWNSRAAMIGLISLVLLEFVAGKGILELIGVEVGKGLDIGF